MSRDPFTGRHALPKQDVTTTRKTAYAAGFTLIAACVITLLVLLASQPNGVAPDHGASPRQSATVTAQTPAGKAYTAFLTWQRKPTRQHLDELITDSYALPAKYDAADITQLAADVLGGAKAKYVAQDEAYVAQDLTEAALPMAS
jgi:hypothetical protein